MMTRAEFRVMRDEYALGSYPDRLRKLRKQRNQLRKDIAALRLMIASAGRHGAGLEDDKKALDWKFQDVSGEISAIRASGKEIKKRLYKTTEKQNRAVSDRLFKDLPSARRHI